MRKLPILAVFAGTCLLAGVIGPAAADELINKASGSKVLDATKSDVKNDGCSVRLWSQTGGNNQLWKVEDQGNGYVKIINQASGKFLTPNTDLMAKVRFSNGCNVMLWAAEDGPGKLKGHHQEWKLQKNGAYYVIINRASGKVLDANAPDVNKNGCRIQLWEYTKGAPEQLWKLVK